MSPQSTAPARKPATGFQWIHWARTRGLKGPKQMILLVLSTHANGDGMTPKITIDDLALDSGRSRRTTIRALQALTELGYVTSAGPSQGAARTYQLVVLGA